MGSINDNYNKHLLDRKGMLVDQIMGYVVQLKANFDSGTLKSIMGLKKQIADIDDEIEFINSELA